MDSENLKTSRTSSSGDEVSFPTGKPIPDQTPNFIPNHQQDVIVIRKSLFITAVIGLTALLVGAIAGYSTFAYAVNRGLAQAGPAVQQPPSQPAEEKIEVSADDDPSIGPKDAPITIVEFSDFQCPYCAQFHTATYDQLKQKYAGKVRWVYRDFPLPGLHSDAGKAAEAANCALRQGQDKYWALNEALYKNQATMGVGINAIHTMTRNISGLDTVALDKCINSGKMAEEISKDVQDGGTYGVTATPTFFINGHRLVGAQSLASFSTMIDSLIAK